MSQEQKERAEQFRKQQLWKAEMFVRSNDSTGDLDYGICVLLLKDVLRTVEDLPVFDPAFEHFVRQASHWRSMCTALALIDGKEAKDHLQEVKVIWSYDEGRVIEETSLWIPLGTRPNAVDHELKVAGTLRLAKAGVEPKMANTLEVVRA